jgi:hypothetical protein
MGEEAFAAITLTALGTGVERFLSAAAQANFAQSTSPQAHANFQTDVIMIVGTSLSVRYVQAVILREHAQRE